ncbi:MAG: DUF4859 domain-containing protein [Marinifilaceae bacterium]|nr:DUF4859 domain-containing protein [Marinifilaceae bacterium]
MHLLHLLAEYNLQKSLCKIVKQAAYQAPEDTPVPPVTEYETVTVTLDIVPGAAGTTVSAEEVAAKLGVADLAAALADGTVTYAGLNADGSVYTAEDGTVPPFTTNGPYGHWYNSEGNPIIWGTPDPNETGAVRLAYLEGDGVTYNLGYDNSSSLTPGTTYAIAGLYSNGDTKVKFEVAINVGEAPVADYVLEVEVAQDNGYGATYIALDGTEFGYWGAYSDPDKYMTTIQDVSVDITGEIEAKLGLDEGALEDALFGGDVLLGAYGVDADNNQYFRDAYEEHGSNYFFWYTVEGVAVGWGQNSVFCIDNIGYHDGNPQLYGTTCMFPTDAQIGTTYSAYIVFKAADESAEYVVEVKGTAVAAPEKQPLKEYTVVETYEKTYATVNPDSYTTPDPMFSNEDIIADIQTLIGGEVSQVLMSYLDDNLEEAFQEWSVTDGWFAANGAAGWGSQAVMFCLKPNTDGTFGYCAAINEGAVDAAVTFRYCNDTELKAVDVKITVTLTAPEA